MAVYFIRAEPSGPVKIGSAVKPETRLRELQIGNAEPLRLMRSIEGGEPEERWMHHRFQEHRVRGEWFTFHEDMMVALPPSGLQRFRDVGDGSFRDLINRIGPPAIERATGAGYNTIQGWRFRNSVPPAYWPGLIEAASNAGEALTTEDLVRIAAARRPRRSSIRSAPDPRAA